MSASKSHILTEIKRLAQSVGKPLGVRLFERATGIKESDWYPHLWLRWGDALQEAGLTRNTMQEGFSDETLVEHYARLAQKLSRLPVQVRSFASEGLTQRFRVKRHTVVSEGSPIF